MKEALPQLSLKMNAANEWKFISNIFFRFRIPFNSAEERDADVTELDIEIRLVQICRGFSLSS